MVVPIRLEEGLEYDAVLDAVVSRLERIASLLRQSDKPNVLFPARRNQSEPES